MATTASIIFAVIAALVMIFAEIMPAGLSLDYNEELGSAKKCVLAILLGIQLVAAVIPLFVGCMVLPMIIVYVIFGVMFYVIYFMDDDKIEEMTSKTEGQTSTSKSKKNWLKWGLLAAVASGIVVLICSSLVLVQPGQRAVKTSWGKVQNKTHQPGLVWKVPYTESLGNKVIVVETRPQRYAYDVPVRTKDMQKVSLDCAVLLEINPDSVHVMYDKYQDYSEYEERVVKDLVNSVVLSISSRMDFWSFAGNENEMMNEAVEYIVRDQLMSENLVKVSSFRVLKYTPSKEVEDLIEEIVKTKKGIELEQYKVEMARVATERVREEAMQEYERIAAVAKANGIDVQIKAEALRNPFVAQYELAKAIQNWNGKLTLPNTLMMMGSGTNGLLPIVPMTVR
ncbi:MAG: hypothetical protein J6T72_02420 [Alphaproteobacteria bacterium]|nr:hypothetical protein [Alphaproteobacteria bacterium]